MTPIASPAVQMSHDPALLAEFAAWQALVTEPARAVSWLDDELDDAPTPQRGGRRV